jgi:hypothetical protein
MEDERVSTVASTAPDRTLLLSANHHRAPAPKYRSPPPYNQIRSGASKSSINHIEYGGHDDDDDYADYVEDDYRDRSSPLHHSLARSPEMGDEVYYTHEYTPRRHLEPNGTMRSTTTINSIRHNDSISRLHQHKKHTNECGKFSCHFFCILLNLTS